MLKCCKKAFGGGGYVHHSEVVMTSQVSASVKAYHIIHFKCACLYAYDTSIKHLNTNKNYCMKKCQNFFKPGTRIKIQL